MQPALCLHRFFPQFFSQTQNTVIFGGKTEILKKSEYYRTLQTFYNTNPFFLFQRLFFLKWEKLILSKSESRVWMGTDEFYTIHNINWLRISYKHSIFECSVVFGTLRTFEYSAIFLTQYRTIFSMFTIVKISELQKIIKDEYKVEIDIHLGL